jgi:hypothetical protein
MLSETKTRLAGSPPIRPARQQEQTKMPLDPYQLCPCGSGKKLKFCCHELSGEIEKIHRKLDGDQQHAALRQIDTLLAKYPQRASLLDLKGVIELQLGNVEAARQAAQQIIDAEPTSPVGNALLAQVLCVQQQPNEAIAALQTALEHTSQDIPTRVYEAVGTTGHALLMAGELHAAREHLWFYQALSGAHETQAIDLIVRMNRMDGMPLAVRQRRTLRPFADDHPLASVMNPICKLAANGLWRKAAAMCDEVLPDHLDQPQFIYNRALLSGCLGDTKNLVAGLRLYARQNVPYADAIEAEALACMLDESLSKFARKAVRLTWTVSDEDNCFERLNDHACTYQYDGGPEKADEPPPRVSHGLLDRPAVQASDDLQPQDLPLIVGLISLFGRQTDRPSRVEVTTDHTDLDTIRELVASILGDGQLGEPTIDELPDDISSSAIRWRWHFPPGISHSHRRKLVNAERRRRLLEVWPDEPHHWLMGKTPREAAADPAMQLVVDAGVLSIEHSVLDIEDLSVIDQMRAQLGLPRFDPNEIDSNDPALVLVSRLPRIDLSTFSDEQLVRLLHRSSIDGAELSMWRVGDELLRRQSPLITANMYEQLFSIEQSDQAALDLLDQARRWSTEHNKPLGRWDLLELQHHLFTRNTAEVKRLINHIPQAHSGDAQVMEQYFELLAILGFTNRPDSTPTRRDTPAARPIASEAADGSSPIWTPEGTPTGEASQKLWLPG